MRIRTEPCPIATLPPGRYYVGDPSYAFPSSTLWEGWVERAESVDREGLYAAEANGHPVAACGLIGGIGDVVDQDGFDYVEDSGLIGAVPVELVAGSEDVEQLRPVTFATEFDVYVTGPLIHIGHLRIDASEDYDDEEDEMDDLRDAVGQAALYELRARRSKSDTWVVPCFKQYRRELELSRDEIDERIAEGRLDGRSSAPIKFRAARRGAEGDLLWTKDADVTVASNRLVAALQGADLTGFSTFAIDVDGTDLGERYVGLVAHRALGGTDVFAPYRSVLTSSFMVNQRAMDALTDAGTTEFRVVPVG
ncbi:MAG: hypothetical protein L0K86_28320 [Actinomycetia bacterium]|nr:hypothetical protein [Actinomycetes bacterium]